MTSVQDAKSTECFEFIWRRRTKGPGFRWERQPSGRTLLIGPPDDSLFTYEPLGEETGLFLTFAHLDGSNREFLRFANTYGRLGTYHCLTPMLGEPLDEWRRHHRWMRFLVKLRSACIDGRRGLANAVSWNGNDVVYTFPKIGTGSTETWRHRGRLCTCPESKKGMPLFRPNDLRGPALWFLGFAIDEWLQELEGHRKPIAPRIVWSEKHGRPQFVFGPSSLLGAMICQFAAALHGIWPFKECACCRKFFRLEPGVNRANRLTCSHTCKQYLYHRRVERARELHAEGRTIRQIAKELNVKPQRNKPSIEIVKTWIDGE